MGKRRLFNFRPVCFFALFLAAGIIVAEALYPVSHLYRLIPLVASLAAAAVLFVLPKTRKFAFTAVAFALGILSMSGAADVYDSRLIDDYSGTFTASVTSEIVVEEDRATFYVGNIHVDGRELNGEAKVYLYVSDAPGFGAGDVVSITGFIGSERHEAFDSYVSYNAMNGEYFYVAADSVVKLADGEVSFPDNIALAVKQMFYEHTDADTAAICTALILGDKRGMDDALYDDVKASGLAHVLAVSGLHVTALATAVYLLFSKLRLNRKIAFAIVLVLTLFYVALCGFTPSAVRAFVMTAVFNFGSAFGFKRDGLSSLALAASLILIFSPFSIMHAGFLLSVFAVFGIMAFADPLTDLFMKITDKLAPSVIGRAGAPGGNVFASLHTADTDAFSNGRETVHKVYDNLRKRYVTVKEKPLRRILIRVSEAAAVAIAANIATYPFVAFFFGEVQTLFVISNIVILPYMMFIYIILLIITPFALITTLHGLVGAADWLLYPFKAFTTAVGAIPFASVPFSVSVAGVVCFTLCVVLASRFVFLRRHERAAAVLVVCALGLFAATLAGVFV